MGTTTLTAQEIRLYADLSIGDTVYTADQKDHTVSEYKITKRTGVREASGYPLITYEAKNEDGSKVSFLLEEDLNDKIFLDYWTAALRADI